MVDFVKGNKSSEWVLDQATNLNSCRLQNGTYIVIGTIYCQMRGYGMSGLREGSMEGGGGSWENLT